MQDTRLIGIVDDDPDIPTALASLIRSLGYNVRSFASAEALLSSDDLSRFICGISDIHMPRMSGLELASTLKRGRMELPVILMTGRLEPGLAEQAALSGAIAFLTKPFGLDALLQAINLAVSG